MAASMYRGAQADVLVSGRAASDPDHGDVPVRACRPARWSAREEGNPRSRSTLGSKVDRGALSLGLCGGLATP